MTIADARAYFVQYARNADDYSTTQQDRAIIMAGNDFVNRTRCTRTTFANVTTTDGSNNIDPTEWPTGFRPDRLQRLWYATDFEQGIKIGDISDVLAMHDHSAEEGEPTHIAFTEFTKAVVYPTPDAAYEISGIWVPPFTVYEAGTTTTSTVLNIPDDLIIPVITYGAVAVSQHSLIEHQGYVREARKQYDDHIQRTIGAFATLGAQSVYRARIAD